jgi:hypothetical protein
LLGIGQLVACGGDDAAEQASVTDSGASPSDATTSDDSASMTDSPSGSGDSGRDGGGEASDGATDADAAPSPEASVDSGACPIAIPAAQDFVTTVGTLFCKSFASCCNIGSNFNDPLCLSFYADPAGGGLLGIGNIQSYIDGGRITYDTGAACECLETIATLNCGLVTEDTESLLRTSCYEALHGTSPTVTNEDDAGDAAADTGGQSGDAETGACAASYECSSGFCSVTLPSDMTDASLGTCRPLLPDGGPCTSQAQCGYLGGGSLYCAQNSACAPKTPTGQSCSASVQCVSGQCGSTQQGLSCTGGFVFSSGPACALFSLPDAGPDAGSIADAGNDG